MIYCIRLREWANGKFAAKSWVLSNVRLIQRRIRNCSAQTKLATAEFFVITTISSPLARTFRTTGVFLPLITLITAQARVRFAQKGSNADYVNEQIKSAMLLIPILCWVSRLILFLYLLFPSFPISLCLYLWIVPMIAYRFYIIPQKSIEY